MFRLRKGDETFASRVGLHLGREKGPKAAGSGVESDVLFLGPPGGGKSVLIKRLHRHATEGDQAATTQSPMRIEVDSTLPTHGQGMAAIKLGKKNLTLREVGGSFNAVWHKYVQGCTQLVYVIDTANPAQIPMACMEFYRLLSMKAIAHVPILIVLNKTDVPDCLSTAEVESVMRLHDAVFNSDKQVNILTCSAYSGKGVHAVVKWLSKTTDESGIVWGPGDGAVNQAQEEYRRAYNVEYDPDVYSISTTSRSDFLSVSLGRSAAGDTTPLFSPPQQSPMLLSPMCMSPPPPK